MMDMCGVQDVARVDGRQDSSANMSDNTPPDVLPNLMLPGSGPPYQSPCSHEYFASKNTAEVPDPMVLSCSIPFLIQNYGCYWRIVTTY